ncbi:hypothetical protein JY651_25325 [Pyxidicoccus parkwayensis]|uniref:Uncharacterized protein n=1 Tax=Pyxidicoccus parkwayensis TaxID=2813578 RepID=A0ABX7NIL7_9BACT|nr:hypothetical protein [Pyxidicoccus parkwaysis]QSQ18686.1 hypothetical protein JY651_25325 [Pyxidicoccus parkwaysis]
MPPSAKPSTPAPAQELPTPSYPAVESLIESTSAEEVRAFFAPVKAGLAELKGPKVEQGKKAQAAVARAEELLELLVETRERLIAEAKGGKGRR